MSGYFASDQDEANWQSQDNGPPAPPAKPIFGKGGYVGWDTFGQPITQGLRGLAEYGTGLEESLGSAFLNQGLSYDDPDYERVKLDDQRKSIAKFFGPSPEDQSTAGEIVGGLARTLVPALTAGPGAPIVMGQESGRNAELDAETQGLDATTVKGLKDRATYMGFAQGLIPGAVTGKLVTRIGEGAAINFFAGGIQRDLTSDYLRSRRWDKIADQYKWDDATSIASDLILGGVFGALHHVPSEAHGGSAGVVPRETGPDSPDGGGPSGPSPHAPSGDEIAAALAVKDIRNRDIDIAPGIPSGPGAHAIHAENLRRTQAAFANDESPSDLLPYTVEDSPRERTPAQQIAHEIEWAHYRNSQFDTMHGSEADNATLEKYRAAGVDTELTGSDLRESIAKAGLGDAEAQAPTPDFIPHPVNHEAIARVHEALNDSSFSDEDRAALLEALPLEDTEALALKSGAISGERDPNGDLMYSRGRPKDPEQEASVIKAIANGEVHAKAAKRLGYKHENSFNTISRRIRKRAKELRGEGRDDKFIANYFNSDEKSIGKLLAEPETLNAINPDTGLTRDQDRQREYMLSLDEARGAGEKVSNAIIGSEFEPMHTAAMVAQGLKKARNAVRALTDAGKSKAEVAKAWLVSPDVIDSLMALDRSNYKDGPSAQQARILELLTPRPDGSYRTYEDIAKALRAETVHSDDPGSKATAESVAVQVINLRNAGIDVPYRAPGKKGEGVSLEQVWALHDQGMSQSAIARALKRTPGRINQLMKSGRPEGVPESKPTAGRYDLATREARKAWVDSPRNVLDAPIPGEASTSREYGFMLDGREPIVVQIKPLAGGLAEVDWGFPHRFKENPDADPFAPMEGGFTLSEKGALLARLVAIMEKDSGKFARDGYKFFPATEGLGRTYQKLFARFGQLGYKFVERDGDAYLIRDGAELTDNGRLIRAEDSAEPQPKWEDLDADEIEARQDAYYQSLETLGTRSDDGRAMGGRAGDDGQDTGAQGGEADERFSRSSTGRSTPDELKAKLEDRIGTKDLQPALDASNVILGNDQTEVRPSVTLEGHGGLFDPRTGKVYINADQTSVERALPVLLHEMGEHHSMEAVIGPRLYGALQKQLQMLHDNGHPIVKKAFALAQEHANRPDHLPSERLAYTIEEDAVARGGSGDIGEGALPPVKFENGSAQHADRALAWLMENAPDLPIVQRTLASVRQWLARTFGEGFGRNLTLDDIHQLAIASLRRGLREAQVKAANEGDIFSSMARRAPTFYSALSKSVSESKTGKASSLGKWLADPDSVRIAADNLFGRKDAALLSLDVVQSGMLPALKHDEVRKAVVELIPVDVMDVFRASDVSPEEIFGKKNVITSKLPVASRGMAVLAIRRALTLAHTAARAELRQMVSGAADREVLPAVRASLLDMTDVLGIVSPRTIVDAHFSPVAPEPRTATGAPAEASLSEPGGLGGSEVDAAELTRLLENHSALRNDGSEAAIVADLRREVEAPLSESLRSQALDEGFPLFSAGRVPKNWRVIAGDKPALTEREKYNEALFDQIENHDEFGDLHADIGDMARRLSAKLDAAPEETAASAAERDGFADGAHAFGSDAELNDLAAKADAGATAQELASHPVIQGVAKEAASQVPTMKPESARDASFWRKRRYVVNGKRVPLAKALDHLERQADSAGKPAKFDKQALVVIGPQGAGKSSFIKAWAKAMGAAVPDADMAKEVIPEYKGGQGTIAAHAEGLQLRERVTERLLGKGRNIIIERVGFNPDNEAKMRELVAMGYEVRLAHIDVSGDEAARRATKRFLATGRYPMNFADYDKAHTLRDIFNKLIETDAVKGHIQVNADGQIPHVTAEHNSPELAGHVSDGLGGLLADRPGSERGDGRSDEAAGAGQERNPDPVKQTLADDPGLTIATDEGEIPGEKALADAEAEEAGAKEMAKGFKAAASCAIQHGLGPGIRVSSDIAAAAFARRTAAYAAGAAAGGVIANTIQTSPTSERWNETALMNQQRNRMALDDYNRRNIPNDLNNAEKVTPVDAEIQQEQPALSELQAPSDADTAGGAGYAPGQTDSKVAPADAPGPGTFGLPSPVNDGSAYAASVAASRETNGMGGE